MRTQMVFIDGQAQLGSDNTFTGLNSFVRQSQTGVAESHAEFRVSDDAVGFGRIGNYTATNGVMVMMERGVGASASEFAHAWVAQAGAAADSGGLPLGIFQAVNNAIAALANRPPFGWYNGGNLLMDMTVAGDVQLRRAGGGLRVTEGANCKQGVATLTAGTVTVSNNTVTAVSRIIPAAQDNNSTGSIRVSARVPGVSFTLTSDNPADNGLVAYEIFEPA